VFGAGYDGATSGSALGIWNWPRLTRLEAHENMIGLDLAALAVDGCTTQAVRGRECAGTGAHPTGLGEPSHPDTNLGTTRDPTRWSCP
jgi:hypothetical protein